MALTPGTRFGSYEVATLIGTGGMGEARQIANTLEAAHDQGIVHRDLNPANVHRGVGVGAQAPPDDHDASAFSGLPSTLISDVAGAC